MSQLTSLFPMLSTSLICFMLMSAIFYYMTRFMHFLLQFIFLNCNNNSFYSFQYLMHNKFFHVFLSGKRIFIQSWRPEAWIMNYIFGIVNSIIWTVIRHRAMQIQRWRSKSVKPVVMTSTFPASLSTALISLFRTNYLFIHLQASAYNRYVSNSIAAISVNNITDKHMILTQTPFVDNNFLFFTPLFLISFHFN